MIHHGLHVGRIRSVKGLLLLLLLVGIEGLLLLLLLIRLLLNI
jgi:hypothetical protein